MKDKDRFEFLEKELAVYKVFYSKGGTHRWGSSPNYFGCSVYHSSKKFKSCMDWAEGFYSAIKLLD